MNQPLLQPTDLRGLTRLTTDAVIGLTALVEAMHARIASPPRLPFGREGDPPRERTRGITGLVYRSIGGVTQLVGGSVESLLGLLEPLLSSGAPNEPERLEREAVLAALNGVLGDHLAASRNPLAIAMRLHHTGRPLVMDSAALLTSVPAITGKPLVLIHGLCMNHRQWHRNGHDHGDALARELGYTPLYLHYNSGLNIATNGRLFADQLQSLVDAWPVPIERLVLMGHSMGGLVARSALHHASRHPPLQGSHQAAHRDSPGDSGTESGDAGHRRAWSSMVDDLVCLGSPHQGAPLERAGHGIDVVLSAVPYAAPLARLGKVRSAGIHDLRHGAITSGPSNGPPGARPPPARIPPAVRIHAIAGSLGPSRQHLKTQLLGDGLVPVTSALGHHRDPERRVHFEPQRQAVVDDTGHLDLLSSTVVYGHLKRWLS